ncbi:MAG: winged helix-turn-helix transcriptional regulator [Thermoleophilia bacterium]
MLGRDYRGQNCSIARALEVVGERWTLLIVRDAFLGVTRFDRFARKLGIAPNVLANRLARLCDAGVLERRPYEGNRHEYVLTDRGTALFPAVVGLLRWGDALQRDGEPVLLRHLGCGGAITDRAVCADCGHPVAHDEVEWLWGPGSPDRPVGERFLPRPA